MYSADYARQLEAENGGLRDKVDELKEQLAEFSEGDREYYQIVERLTDERNAAIEQARSDLEGLQHVPLHDLEASIQDTRQALLDVL